MKFFAKSTPSAKSDRSDSLYRISPVSYTHLKFYDLATMQPEVPVTVQSHYELLEKTASACIDCHACESRCPFGVKIAERMKKTAELFGC